MAARLERLQLPLSLQGGKVDLCVLHPQISHDVNPPGVHRLDVVSFLGDMAVLGRVVVAYNEMGYVGGQIVLVDAAELLCPFGNLGLRSMSEKMVHTKSHT